MISMRAFAQLGPDAVADGVARQLFDMSKQDRERFTRRLDLRVRFPETFTDAPYSFWLGREAA